jgi:TP901 family phage tail tape measure protein
VADLRLGVKIGVQGGAQSAKEIRNLDDQVKRLQEQNAKAASTAKSLGAAYNLSGAEVDQLINELRQLEGQTRSTAGEARKLDAVFQGLLQGFGQQLTQIGFQAFNSAVRGVGNVIGGSISSFVEFQGALQQAGAISQSIGTPQFEALGNEIERLGIVTSKTPIEIAKTAVELTRAGFSATETADALEGIARASEATGESLATVGDIVAKTLRAYGLQASQSLEVANTLVATANATNTSVSGLGESFKYVAPAAAAANQSVATSAILLGALGDAGIQGSQAGTNLAAALDRLKTASAGANSEYGDLVKGNKKATQAYDLLAASVRDSNGEVRDLLQVIPEIQAGLENLSSGDQDLVLKALFGIEGGRAFQTIANTSIERIQEITEEVAVLSQEGEGAAVKTGKLLLEGLSGSLDLIGGSIGTLRNQLGEAFGPALEGSIRFLTDVINKIIEAGDSFSAIQDAGTRFAETLRGNPEFVIELANAFTDIAKILSQGIADQINRITTALQTNPQIISELAARFVSAAEAAGRFVASLLQIAGTVGRIGASFAGAAGSLFTSLAPTLSALVGVINSAVQALQPLLSNTKLVEVAFQALVVQMIAVRAQNLVSTFTQITGGLVAMTRSVIASTAATRALATAQATGSRSGLLLAQNLAAQGAAARTAIQGFAGAAAAGAQFALLAGAIASVSVALSRFKDGGAALNEGADDIRKSLAEVQLELQGTSSQAAATQQGLLELFPAEPPPTDFLDKITEKLVQIRERIDGIIKSVPGMQQALLLVPGANVALNLLPDTTNAEKQLNDQKIALENILTATDEVIRSTEQFGTTGVNATGQYVSSQKQAQTQLEAINATLLGLQRQQEGLDPATLGADAYQQFTTQINASIKALEQEKLEFQRRFDLVDSYQDLVTQNAKALQKIETDSLNAQAKLVEAGEPQTRILQVEADALNKRVAQNRVYADKLKTAIEAGILDPKEVQQAQLEIESIERDSADARLAIANKQKEIAQAVSDALADSAEEQKKSLEGLTAANQKALSDLELAAANTRATILEAGGDPAKLAQAEQQALKDRIDANKDFLAQLKELTPAEGEEAQKTADQIRQTELTLANDRVALAQQVLEAKVKAAEEVAKAEVDRLKEARDTERESAQTEFDTQQEQARKRFGDEDRARQEAFDETQQNSREAFNESQRDADEAFQLRQQNAQKAFQKAQQAEAKRFQDQLNAERDRGNREFDALQKEVDRRAQLAEATGAERADLQRQFDEEDRRAKERRKIEQQVLNQRGSVLADQGDLLNLSPLEQARAAFEQSLQEKQVAFDEQQQIAQEAFEVRQRADQKIFEDQQKEDQRLFDKVQREDQKLFETSQQVLQEQFQSRQQAAEAAFNAQQRQLDEQSAQRQAAILEAASRGIAPQVQARRDGGPVAAGQPYLVGEEGPELITPTRRGWVHTAGETAAIMARQPVMAIKPQSIAGVEAKLSELLQEVRRGRRVVAPTSFTLNTQNPLSDAVELQIKQVRALARGRVL